MDALDRMNDIVKDIVEERLSQKQRVIGRTSADEFDNTNSQNDWVSYIVAYAGRASAGVRRNAREGWNFRSNMVKVAALALAAIEAHDIKEGN